MTTVKTYGWLGPERLKFINDNPKVVSLLYDLGLLPEEISARVRGYVEDERERIAKLFETKGPNDMWRAADAARLIRNSSEAKS